MDPRQRLQDALDATRTGRHAEALEHHIWFHEHALAHEPSLYGVRLSFALHYWIELAESYPPAREALESIKRRKTAAVLGGEHDRALFHDVKSINHVLGSDADTVDLFKAIAETAPDFAQKCMQNARFALVQAGEFDLSRRFMPRPEATLDQRANMLNENVEFAREADSEEQRTRLLDAFAHNCASEVAGILEVLSRTGDAPLANDLRDRFVGTINDSAVRNDISSRLAAAAAGESH